jgi:hypothetical protein
MTKSVFIIFTDSVSGSEKERSFNEGNQWRNQIFFSGALENIQLKTEDWQKWFKKQL